MKIITLLGVLAATTITLSSCGIIKTYRGSFQQGDIISQHQFNRVKMGMRKKTVLKLLGNPILSQPLTPNRLVYIDRFQPGYGTATQTKWVFSFKNNRVSSIQHPLASPKA